MRRYGILLLLISIRLLPGLQPGGGYMCKAGCTVWGIPDSPVPGTVGYYPNPRIFWEPFGRCQLCGAPLRVFRLPCKVYE
jgi:hypothetical protein